MLPITLKIVAADGRIRQAATAEGSVHLIYRAPYEPGDRLVLDAGAPGRHLVVQLEDTMPPALLYGAEAQLCFPVPFGDAAIVYSPKAFSGDCHVLRARPAAPAEAAARRSLAFNPYDLHQPTGWYPHAHANVETRGEAVFAARNAIDGVWENDGHGLWPWQSWGINRDPRAALTVEFGRPARVEEIRLTLRADFPHDSWWTAATAAFSDGSRERLSLRKTAAPQTFVIPPRTVTRLTLCELQKADDESPFPALTQLEVWGTDTPI